MCSKCWGWGDLGGGAVFWSGWSVGFAFWEPLNQQHTYAMGARTTHSSVLTPGLDLVGQSVQGRHAAVCKGGGRLDALAKLEVKWGFTVAAVGRWPVQRDLMCATVVWLLGGGGDTEVLTAPLAWHLGQCLSVMQLGTPSSLLYVGRPSGGGTWFPPWVKGSSRPALWGIQPALRARKETVLFQYGIME